MDSLKSAFNVFRTKSSFGTPELTGLALILQSGTKVVDTLV